MLKKVTAFSPWRDIPELGLNLIDTPPTQLFEVRNIDGLGPVKANVNTSTYGATKGAAYTGSSVDSRNLVFTIGFNPDWDEWTISKLRRLLDKYFMAQFSTRLVFETEEHPPVEISGIVETVEPNIFSKDPETQVSVICPEPDFVAVTPVVVNGVNGGDATVIEYGGSVKTGVNLKVEKSSGADATQLVVQFGNDDDPAPPSFQVDAPVSATQWLELNSVERAKYIRNIAVADSEETNVLQGVLTNSTWPFLDPEVNFLSVNSDAGVQDWELTYYERFGSL